MFPDLAFAVKRDDRRGLVAANGRAKSALLVCLTALLEPASGDISRARGLPLALVEQDVPPALRPQPLRAAEMAALSDAMADSESWRAEIVLDDLAIPEALRDHLLNTLSGGWQRTALLTRAAVTEPGLYLLDEPTSHLNLSRIGLLHRSMAALPHDTGAILTSHDPAFLDEATTRTLFLRLGRSNSFVRNVGTRFWQIDEKPLTEVDSPEPFFRTQMQA